MLAHKERKVASTVHLYQRQILQIDKLAQQTGHSRARILREVVEAGLAAVAGEERRDQHSLSVRRKAASERLLRMSLGYGESTGKGMEHLDAELYGDV
jgi:hypothetical protein